MAMQNPYGVPTAQPAAAPKRYDGKNGQPQYDSGHGGHYGASAHISAQGHAPPPETFTGHWQNVSMLPTRPLQLLLTNMSGVTRIERAIS